MHDERCGAFLLNDMVGIVDFFQEQLIIMIVVVAVVALAAAVVVVVVFLVHLVQCTFHNKTYLHEHLEIAKHRISMNELLYFSILF